MHVTYRSQATAYQAPGHTDMTAFRLQGLNASPTDRLWVGLSVFHPGGGAELASSAIEKIYVVLEGEITVTTATGEVTLGPQDSVLLEANEARTIKNNTAQDATMLVIAPR